MVHLLNVAGCAAAACACWPEPVSSWRCDLWPRLVKTPFTWGWGWGGVSEYALLCSVQYAGPSVKVKLLAEYNIHQGSQKHHNNNNNNKFSIDNTSSSNSSNNTNSAVSQVKCDADAVYFFFFLFCFGPTPPKAAAGAAAAEPASVGAVWKLLLLWLLSWQSQSQLVPRRLSLSRQADVDAGASAARQHSLVHSYSSPRHVKCLAHVNAMLMVCLAKL